MRTVRKSPTAPVEELHAVPSSYFLVVPAVVKTTVLLADMNDFTKVNDVYKQCKYDGLVLGFSYCAAVMSL